MRLNSLRWIVLGLGCLVCAPAQTFTTIHSFQGADGAKPRAVLTQSQDGILYGTASLGGTANGGTTFSVTEAGGFTKLSDFGSIGTANPVSPLLLGADGALYGSTAGVDRIPGIAFRMDPAGKVTPLHTFVPPGSLSPQGLVNGWDGNLYGVTFGSQGSSSDYGSVFKITPQGAFSTLHTFTEDDGANPNSPLALNGDGTFFGTTFTGGSVSDCYPYSGCGTLFSISPKGAFKTLQNWETKQANPQNGPTLANDGNLYLADSYGDGYGSILRIKPDGTFRDLHSMTLTEGAQLLAPLSLGSDGNFYGTAYVGGAYGFGTVFRVTPTGTLTVLHNFMETDGAYPLGGVSQATDGSLYGTTSTGGDFGYGTVFRIDVGLQPFVLAVPGFGKAGQKIQILGGGLSATTAVTFQGVAAQFQIASDTCIIATVPPGAATGQLAVMTPSGTQKSSVLFRVHP